MWGTGRRQERQGDLVHFKPESSPFHKILQSLVNQGSWSTWGKGRVLWTLRGEERNGRLFPKTLFTLTLLIQTGNPPHNDGIQYWCITWTNIGKGIASAFWLDRGMQPLLRYHRTGRGRCAHKPSCLGFIHLKFLRLFILFQVPLCAMRKGPCCFLLHSLKL